MATQNQNKRYSYTASIEWYPRATIDINMAGEHDKRVTVYHTDFPGSTLGSNTFWDSVTDGGWELFVC
jgi:hypothetical protein